MDDRKRKLYYVDSVKLIDNGENAVIRVLSQESYSFNNREKKYFKISPALLDKQLIRYYRDNKEIMMYPEGIDDGFRDGVFVRLSENKHPSNNGRLMLLTSEDLDNEEIILYPTESQQEELPELEMQKDIEYSSLMLGDIHLTENSKHQEPKLYCFNVGQGDMSLFISSEGHAFIIDTHIIERNKKCTLDDLKRILGKRPIEALIFTHRHFDHYAGAYLLLRDKDIKVKYIIVNQSFVHPKQPNQINKLFYEATKNACKIIAPTEPQLTISDGETKIHLSFHNGNTDENDNSILIQIYDQNNLYYLTGDMGFEILENEAIISAYKKLVLKVSHHGSRTGTSCQFLCKFYPENIQVLHRMYQNCEGFHQILEDQNFRYQAFISAGKNNRYHHPHPETIQVLSCAGFNIEQSNTMNTIHKEY